jgi:hypothetical protein
LRVGTPIGSDGGRGARRGLAPEKKCPSFVNI